MLSWLSQPAQLYYSTDEIQTTTSIAYHGQWNYDFFLLWTQKMNKRRIWNKTWSLDWINIEFFINFPREKSLQNISIARTHVSFVPWRTPSTFGDAQLDRLNHITNITRQYLTPEASERCSAARIRDTLYMSLVFVSFRAPFGLSAYLNFWTMATQHLTM